MNALLLNFWLYTIKGCLVFASLVLMPLVLGLGLILSEKNRIRLGLILIWIYGRVWFYACRPVFGFKVIGEDNLPDIPCILVANHQSILDIYCFGAQKIWNLAMVVRGWPLQLPFLGPFMRMAGYLDADLEPENFLLQARKLLSYGTSLLFFPEGTRRKGTVLSRFKSGAFQVAVQNNIPVVSVCIKGTGEIIPPKKKLFSPGRIEVKILPPIFPADFRQEKRPAKAMSIHVRQNLNNCLDS